MDLKQAENILGLVMDNIHTVTVGAVLKQLNYQKMDFITQTRDEVRRQIVKFLDVEGFPGIDYETKEANINNIVYAILSTIVYDVRKNTGRTQLHIHREASIVGIRGVTAHLCVYLHFVSFFFLIQLGACFSYLPTLTTPLST